jgi:hypothetical protein
MGEPSAVAFEKLIAPNFGSGIGPPLGLVISRSPTTGLKQVLGVPELALSELPLVASVMETNVPAVALQLRESPTESPASNVMAEQVYLPRISNLAVYSGTFFLGAPQIDYRGAVAIILVVRHLVEHIDLYREPIGLLAGVGRQHGGGTQSRQWWKGVKEIAGCP